MGEDPKIKRRLLLGLLPVALAVLLLLCLRLFGEEKESSPLPEETSPSSTVTPDPSPGMETPTPGPVPVDADAGKVRIAELMVKNRATLVDEDGEFPDWIELENISEDSVELTGWRLTDSEKKPGWTFPETRLDPGERLLLFADRKDGALHTGFSLSAGETLLLYTDLGALSDQVLCPDGEPDRSWLEDGEGAMRECLYPTPGLPNTPESYVSLMETRETDSPLVINEAAVFNRSIRWLGMLGQSDWVELKNVSDEPVELSDYYLSDDGEDRLLFRLPERKLSPGGIYLLRCDTNTGGAAFAPLCAAFSLSSSADRLYLSRADGSLADYVSLRGIPYGGSFGRMPEENGWFFFAEPSPGGENDGGQRRVSAPPAALEPDGVYEDVDSVTVTLEGAGEIHYTIDGSCPTENSPLYEEPITLEQSCLVRAVSVEEGALPSRAVTLTYLLNEHHQLPVLSLVSDDGRLMAIYDMALKDMEVPCSLALYEEGGGFSLSCGVKMHGETSLSLPKKNMSVRFRGVYGRPELDYDLFGDGEDTVFSNLVLRAGQDYSHAIIRNELCTELARSATDRVVISRSRYCVLYMDGRYCGIYALGEKLNEATYARRAGVSRESVTVATAPLRKDGELYKQVFAYADTHDMAQAEYYEEICARLDVDSLVDWLILEGCSGNQDLSYGNVRYCRSMENDGKWRLMYYDLDGGFYHADNCFTNVLAPWARKASQTAQLTWRLLQNPEFREKLLQRAGELIPKAYTNENILAEIDRLSGQIDAEVARDFAHNGMDKSAWDWNVQWLRDAVRGSDWNRTCVKNLCQYLNVTEEERARYFPD